MLGESEILDDFLSDSRWIRIVIPALLGVLGSCSRKNLFDSFREALLGWLEPALRRVERGRDERALRRSVGDHG